MPSTLGWGRVLKFCLTWRFPRPRKACQSVLFEPYSAEQLRSIVKAQFQAAGEEGEMAEKAGAHVKIPEVHSGFSSIGRTAPFFREGAPSYIDR